MLIVGIKCKYYYIICKTIICNIRVVLILLL